jgi:hypothetical protein
MVSETTITHPPDADATDEDRARLLAADMARTGAIGEQQALVYAFRDVLGFGGRETAGALDKDPSTVDTALYAARDRISDADSLLRVLDAWGENGHGLDPRTVADWTPIEEFDGVRDSFGGATIHRRRDGVWRVGERYLFEDELVIVAGPIGATDDMDATTGYELRQVDLDSGVSTGYAADAEWLDGAIADGRFVPVDVSITEAKRG